MLARARCTALARLPCFLGETRGYDSTRPGVPPAGVPPPLPVPFDGPSFRSAFRRRQKKKNAFSLQVASSGKGTF